ncbi:MAG TPA: hypothetical protein VNN08_06600 [Thermoanaerobaculia bacterium]|nr:hypothetical protein [Thermoanaerobaculia bacterium]
MSIAGLASGIRAAHGAWITRSGIVTALIEAAMRAEAGGMKRNGSVG